MRNQLAKGTALAALLFVVAMPLASVRAATPLIAPLPDGIMLQISVRSPQEALQTADDVISAVTRGSAYRMLVGMLPMLFQLYAPFPQEAWDQKGEVHLLIPPEDINPQQNHAFIISTPGFAGFIKALEDNGINPEIDNDLNCRVVEIPHLGSYFADSAGGKLVMLASSDYMLKTLRDGIAAGWQPKYWGDGILCMDFDLPEGWVQSHGLDQIIHDGLTRLHDLAEQRGSALPVNPEVIKGALRALDDLFPKLEAELGWLRGISLDFRLDKERIGIATHFSAEPGSLIGDMGAAATAGSNTIYPTARFIDDKAATLVLAAPINQVVPNLGERLAILFDSTIGEVFPKQKDRLRQLYLDNVKYANGDSAQGGYFLDGGKAYNVSWLRSDQPDALIRNQNIMATLGNQMLKSVLKDPNSELPFQVEAGDMTAKDNTRYFRMRLAPTNTEKFDQLMEKFDKLDPNIRQSLEKLNILLTVHQEANEKYLVAVSGDADENRLIAVLDAAAGKEPAMVDLPAVKARLADMLYRQSSLLLIDIYQMFAMMVDSMIEETNRLKDNNPKEVQDFATAAKTAKGKFRNTGDMAGFSLGGADGRLVVDMSISTAAINAIRYNAGIFGGLVDRLPKDKRSAQIDEDGAEDEDDYADDDGQNTEDYALPRYGR